MRVSLGRLVERRLQHRQLSPAADQRRLAATHARPLGQRTHEAPRLDRRGLALQVQRRHRREVEGLGRRAPRAGTDHDLARLGRLLQPGRDIHRVAGDGVLGCVRTRRRAADHLSGVDADPDLELACGPA